MKLKNTNFIERHVEKIILAAGACTALVVVWLFVVGNPHGIMVGNEEISPDEIVKAVQQPARQLDQMLVNPEVPHELKISVRGYTDQFLARDQGGVPLAPLDVPSGHRQGLPAAVWEGLPNTLFEYAVAVPPAPAELMARSGLYVLRQHEQLISIFTQDGAIMDDGEHPLGGRQHGKLVADKFVQLVSADLPRDFEAISVMGEFDWEAWVKRLQKRGVKKPIPENWYRGMAGLTDVILERQVRDPKTGSWGAVRDGAWQQDTVARIDPLPGAWNLRKIPEGVDGGMLIGQIEDPAIQEQVCRAMFAPVTNMWLPPDEQQKPRTPEEDLELQSLNRKITDRENRLFKLRERLDKLTQREEAARSDGPEREVRRTPPRRDPASFGNVPGGRQPAQPGMRAPGARGRSGPAPSTTQSLTAQQQNLQNELDDLYYDRDVLLGHVEQLGPEDGTGEPGTAGRPGNRLPFGSSAQKIFRAPTGMPRDPMAGRMSSGLPSGVPMLPQPSANVLRPGLNLGRQLQRRPFGGNMDQRTNLADGDLEEQRIEPIVVWAHDMTVQPGRTYRYRLRVAVRNPFHKRTRVIEAQEPLTEQHSLESEASAWTKEVSTFRKTYFFLVDDGKRDKGGIVELYRRFGGGWQRLEAPVRAGEPIGGQHEFVAVDLRRIINLSDDLGAIVVDIESSVPSIINAERSTVRMLYLDLKSNSLMERTIERDKNDKMRIYLRNEAQLEADRIKMARVQDR